MLLNTYNKRDQNDKDREAGKRPSILRGVTQNNFDGENKYNVTPDKVIEALALSGATVNEF